MLVPERVSVLAPALVRLLAPEITPDNVAFALFVTVAFEESATALSMVVAPVMARLPPFRVRAPVVFPRLLSAETDKVPSVTVVVPV